MSDPVLLGAGGLAVLSLGAAWILIARGGRRRRRSRREVDRVQRVAQAFDVNPADADALSEVALLGSPRNPAAATTDRQVFDSGSALYLTHVLLGGGDLWGAVLSLARLRERFGFEDAGEGPAPAAFLGRVLLSPEGSKEVLEGVVVDRRGGLRVVLPNLSDERLARGDLVEVRPPEGGPASTLAVFRIESAGAGVAVTLGSPTRETPQSRLQTMLPALVRRQREGGEDPPEEATILDLSHGGVCVRLPREARDGERFLLHFDAGRSSAVEVEATVVWSAPAGNGSWRVGARFGELTEASRAAILSFLTPAVPEEHRSLASGVGS